VQSISVDSPQLLDGATSVFFQQRAHYGFSGGGCETFYKIQTSLSFRYTLLSEHALVCSVQCVIVCVEKKKFFFETNWFHGSDWLLKRTGGWFILRALLFSFDLLSFFRTVAAHLCLGAPYAWSLFVAPLAKEMGVVAAATTDWSLPSIVPVISLVFAMQGISAALLGKYMEPLSPRANGLMAAAAFGGGFALAGLGVYLHSLPLLYLGYGFFGGLGIG
jgi:hypothetical protein